MLIFQFKEPNLFNSIVLNYQPLTQQSRLLFSDVVQGSLSRVFRQLMNLKALNYFLTLQFSQSKPLFQKMDRFVQHARNKFLQTGAVLMIKLAKQLAFLKCQLFAAFTEFNHIDVDIQQQLDAFYRLDVKTFEELKQQLSKLLSRLFSTVRVTSLEFYVRMAQLQKFAVGFVQILNMYGKKFEVWMDYGCVADDQMRELHQRLKEINAKIK